MGNHSSALCLLLSPPSLDGPPHLCPDSFWEAGPLVRAAAWEAASGRLAGLRGAGCRGGGGGDLPLQLLHPQQGLPEGLLQPGDLHTTQCLGYQADTY